MLIMADVEKAFVQIGLHDDQRDADDSPGTSSDQAHAKKCPNSLERKLWETVKFEGPATAGELEWAEIILILKEQTKTGEEFERNTDANLYKDEQGIVSLTLDSAPQFQLVKQVTQSTFVAPITWRFITHFAPLQGVVYERLVGLTKTAFRKAVGRRLLNEEEFKTLIVECEAIVNSRPLIYIDSAIERILRPVDFLRRQAIIAAQEQSPENDKRPPNIVDIEANFPDFGRQRSAV
uniref:Integrase catalytic domain-containing protein n=1 Tax=Ascaris lumbricoides TaxID=6252 RepID=A0A0M3HVY6_ASCLU